MSTVTFVIPGNPVAKGRPRFARVRTLRGAPAVRTFTPGKTRDFETLVRVYAAQAMRGKKPLGGPLLLTIEFFRKVPASWSKKNRRAALEGEIHPTTKPDLGNYVKGVEDAMNSIVYLDDAQIVDVTARKRYGEQPRVVVFVGAMA